ncbi:MAG: DUF742 domain-containing protein [Ilumatobacteraceae bacterium]
MSEAPDPNEGSHADAALVRPFLSRVFSPAPDLGAQSDVPEAAGVRSYAMTGGRSTAVVPLEFESMLQTTARGEVIAASLSFERGAIVQLCSTEILSVAELSARLRLPIGVVRVVAADLLSEGLLEAFMSNLSVADDVSLISRLIEGVRAL